MTNLARVRVGLTGWEGAPGVNTLTFSEGTGVGWEDNIIDAMLTEVHTAFSGFKGSMAQGVTCTVSPEVAIFDAANGQIVDVKVSTADLPPISNTQSVGSAPTAVAANITLMTDRFINGRRLRGRLYISPLAPSALTSHGNITGPAQENFEDAFVAMTSGVGTRLAVYHRPTAALATDGAYGDVFAVRVPAKPATLRSRRD